MIRRPAQILATGVALALVLSAVAQETPRLSRVQTDYLERCGGCHGIEGISAEGLVPTLRHRAGYFLCTHAGRDYVARLPSVATSPLSDEALANLINFVAFDIGDAAQLVARPKAYSADEVHRLRTRPLNEVALSAYRFGVIEDLIKHCRAPPQLRDYRPSAAPGS